MNFQHKFYKNTQKTDLMKIRRVGGELFHAGRRTDMKAAVVLYNSANAPTNSLNFF